MIIDVLLEQVASLKQELALIEERSNQIKNTLNELETRLSEVVVPTDSYPSEDTHPSEDNDSLEDTHPSDVCLLETPETEASAEETLPEIEVELIVDETLEIEEEVEDNLEYSENSEHPENSENSDNSDNSDNSNHTQSLLPPIDDIRKGISLGDRFLFQRELFAGDGEKMGKTIENMNKLSSFDEAMTYLNKHFSWDKESQAYELFINLLKRRF